MSTAECTWLPDIATPCRITRCRTPRSSTTRPIGLILGRIPLVSTSETNGCNRPLSLRVRSVPSARHGPAAAASVCSSTRSRTEAPRSVNRPAASSQPRVRTRSPAVAQSSSPHDRAFCSHAASLSPAADLEQVRRDRVDALSPPARRRARRRATRAGSSSPATAGQGDRRAGGVPGSRRPARARPTVPAARPTKQVRGLRDVRRVGQHPVQRRRRPGEPSPEYLLRGRRTPTRPVTPGGAVGVEPEEQRGRHRRRPRCPSGATRPAT